ncbi:Major facilitator superfamily domain-containing protein 6 [Chionoecetes opilio]|uniref:Major facilitator superfamily domain-containing protein 6 n=1 Tax=Chionoecetes opilio TaxID=41210 RepID=A0A8J4YQX3_CHIOP|nr:Major facilitator superfamily domain-containing protein 6 [Chionoecetes opilio]
MTRCRGETTKDKQAGETFPPSVNKQASKMKIDKRMFPMKLHYFLRFMGTGPLTVLLPVVTRQMGVPAHVVGNIWTVLPLVSLITKTTSGAIADITKGHRAVFLLGLVCMVTSLTALYWVPDIPPLSSSSSIASPSSNTSTLPPLSLLTSVASLVTPAGSEGTVEGFSLSTGAPSDAALTPMPLHPQEGDGDYLLGRYEFWLLFVCLLVQYCGHTTVITMQETVCFQLLGEKRHKYGQQRVWGTIGVGLSAIISGALVDLYSKGLGQKDYLPAHVLTAVFLAADILLVAFLKFPHPEKRMSSSALQGALWHPHVMLVLVTTGVLGVVSGVLWTFEFLLVEDVARQWRHPFVHLRLLLGLLMGVQCFLAEAPFFVLAGRIIQKLGLPNALLVSLLGFTVRLILYSLVTNPWLFLPIELLHGISFGVAYPSFTCYASSIAPKGAAATTQAIFGATFFGSTGVGGFVGGRLFKAVGGRKTFLWAGLATGGYSILFVVVHGVLQRVRSANETDVERNTEAAQKLEDMQVKETDVKAIEEEEDARVNLIEVKQEDKRTSVIGVSYRRTGD